MPSKSDDDEQRKSVDRVRAVGQTFANSVFALRDRVVSASGIAEVDSGDRTTTSGGSGMATKVIGTTESPSEGGADATEGGRTKLERDMERLQNMLFATERQLEAARREADALRMAGEAATTRYERQTRTLEAIRAEIDKTAARAIEAEERASRAEAEVVRLRVDGAEADRETARCTKQVEDAERRAAEELARRNALERVAMGLRRRVALAEDAASKTRGLHDAVAARRAAESALVDARTEAERWRARCVSVDALRERADAAERAERSLRERVNVLEREVESRDALLRQTRAERQKLSQMMGYYERELARKDTKISALRRSVRKLRSRRGDEGNDVDSLDNDSVHSLSWDRDAPPSITGDAGEMVRKPKRVFCFILLQVIHMHI